VFALYAGLTPDRPASAQDVKFYAQRVGITDFPVLADSMGAFAGSTPMTQRRHPELCALTPDMRILSCAVGHGAYRRLLDDIRRHSAQN